MALDFIDIENLCNIVIDICLIWMLYFLSWRIFLSIRMFEGYFAIKRLERHRKDGYVLRNKLYEKEDSSVEFYGTIVWVVITIAGIYYVSRLSEGFAFVYYILIVMLVFELSLLSVAYILRYALVRQYNVFAFITDLELVSIDGYYTKGTAQFTLERERNKSTGEEVFILNVYPYIRKKKKNTEREPYRFEIPNSDQEEEILHWIEKNF